MLKNYIKIAARNLLKHKGYSFINIAGLGMGLACCAFILLYVQDELSYDRFHEKADRIYRVVIDAYPPNAPPDCFALASRPVGRTIREEFPEVEHLVRINTWNPVIKQGEAYFYDHDFLFAEPAFFDVFSFPLLKGDPKTALAAPYSLVISETVKRKLFGDADALGQSITLNDSLTFAVTGVMADFPRNSHFKADVLVSFETLNTFQPEDDGWLNLGTYTYVVLKAGVAPEAFAAKIKNLMTQRWGEELQSINFKVDLGLQPLTAIHLHSDRQGEFEANGDISYVYIFSAIALFVLLIACINFMNLATARSMERAKEVGIRKVVGSSRTMLVRQFLSESIFMCVLALVIALVLIVAGRPLFNELSGKEISFETLLEPAYLSGLVAITLLVGILAGSYPAFMLSGFQPMAVLRGAFKRSAAGIALRRSLVVFQFAVSVILIGCTMIVFDQLNYMRTQDLGFDKEQVLVIDAKGLPNNVMAQQYETVKSEFMKDPSVVSAAASAVVPGRGHSVFIFQAEGMAENDSRRAQIVGVDEDYLSTYGIDLMAGRALSNEFETDQNDAALINETAMRNIGWATPEEALGKTITLGDTPRKVVGIVRDYHHNSLKEVLEPMILISIPQTYNYFSLRIDPEKPSQSMAHAEQVWKAMFPGYTFSSFFLDEDYDNQYLAERQLSRIVGVFSFFAILIACLGAFGLAAFTAQQRTKEIGVRKVMGASPINIVALLSKDFTKLVLIAALLAAPVAYFAMERWLGTFPYHTRISIGTFVIAGLLALVIAWLSVSFQSVKAALTNPVKALRYE